MGKYQGGGMYQGREGTYQGVTWGSIRAGTGMYQGREGTYRG